MQLGFIGLGRMGANMSRRLAADGHTVVGYDVDPDQVTALTAEGAVAGVGSVPELVAALDPPRTIWIMIPAAHVEQTEAALQPHLQRGDIVVDGGNSFYRDSVDRAARLEPAGIQHVDVGVSGGIWGRERGYCLMIGGPSTAVDRLGPVFETLAPGTGTVERTAGRHGSPEPAERGWLHCGPAGAGHFVKMVHNGIEYGLMAAYAEGFAILDRADIGREDRPRDAETAPVREPEYYRYDFDLPAVAELWRRGSVIGSWLLDLTAQALVADPGMEGYRGFVSDSGEGRWTVQAAIDEGVPANVLASALHQRFSSRDLGDYGDKLLSALREQFGGHPER